MFDIVDEAISGKGLTSAYQPVVSLPAREVMGYEALARWPHGNNLTHGAILRRARRTGRVSILDQACIRSAVRGAIVADSTPGALLFINCEPGAEYDEFPRSNDFVRAAKLFQIVFEFTERGLLENPHFLLRKVEALRSLGCLIALDDVGALPDSLALLDIVRPDVIKLDMALVQQQPNPSQTYTVAAILAHQERTGAVICAEGIESVDHLERAMAYGATLGQGNFFGPPGDPASFAVAMSAPEVGRRAAHGIRPSSFFRKHAEGPARNVGRPALDELVAHVQRSALAAGCTPIVLTAMLGGGRPTQEVMDIYARLAQTSPLVAVYGADRPPGLHSDIRWVNVERGDPLSDMVFIFALGPDTSAGLAAYRRTGEQHCSPERFSMVLSFDRNRIRSAAIELLDRLE